MPTGGFDPVETEYVETYTTYAEILNGYAVSAPSGGLSGKTPLMMPLDITGIGHVLSDAKAGEMSPTFDNSRVDAVLEYVATIVGLEYDSSYVEDLSPAWNQKLNMGPPDNFFWYLDDGMAWGEFLEEVFMYSGFAGLFLVFNDDEHPVLVKCCPHCHKYRTGDIEDDHYFMNHLDNGPASSGCLTWDQTRTGNSNGVDFYVAASGPDAAAWGLPYDQLISFYPEGDPDSLVLMASSIQAPTLAVEDEYFNQVVIKGVRYGVGSKEPRVSIATDWASVHGSGSERGLDLGRKKTLTMGPIPWANREAIRNYLAWVKYREVARRPEHITVTVPFAPSAWPGKVFGIVGASQLGVHGKKYRIDSFSHSDVRQDNFVDATTLNGTYIGTITPPGGS